MMYPPSCGDGVRLGVAVHVAETDGVIVEVAVRELLGVGACDGVWELEGVSAWDDDGELLGVGACDGVTNDITGAPTTLIPRNWNVEVAIAVAAAPAVAPMRYTSVFVPEVAGETQ